MDKTREQAKPQITPGKGLAGDVNQLKTSATATAEELRQFHIDANVVAPGPLNTRFVDQAIAAGAERLGQPLYDTIMNIREGGGTPFEIGANLCAYLASPRSDGVTGKFISARHDDWETLHQRVPELDSTDIYTMRRIDPATIKKLLDSQ